MGDFNQDGKPDFAIGSISILLNVSPRSVTSTALSITPNPSNYGQSVSISVAVTSTAGGTPTGLLRLFDNGKSLASQTLTNGSTQFAITSFSVGSHLLTASYGSDANFRASTSSASSQLVATAGSVTSLTSSGPSIYGQPVTLMSSINPANGGTATGTVTFSDGATSLGTVSVLGNVATLQAAGFVAGTHTITASYSGDANVTGSSGQLSQGVARANSTVTLGSSQNPTAVKQSATYTAAVAGQFAGPLGGTVTFSDAGKSVGVAPITSGTASMTQTYTIVGTHSISAAYSGDANTTASSSTALSELIVPSLPITTTTSLNPSISPSFVNQPVTFTAKLTAAYGAVPDGELVTFLDGTNALQSVPILKGVAAYTTSSLSVGTHTMHATYGGDTAYKTSTNSATQIVHLYSTATSLAIGPNPIIFGQSATLNASVTGGSPAGITGTVTFKRGAVVVGTSPLLAGSASLSTSTLPVGSDTLTAVYGGDPLNGTSTSAPVVEVVNPNIPAPGIPANFRADVSVGTTGQLIVFWYQPSGAQYYNLQRSTSAGSGYVPVSSCSSLANNKNTQTSFGWRTCHDAGLTVGTQYYYQVQACNTTGCSPFSAAVSNTPVNSDCTPAQIPNLVGVQTLPELQFPANQIDPGVQFNPTAAEFAAYPAPGVPRRNQLLVMLPGSGGSCDGGGVLGLTAQQLGFDMMCVNYSNTSSQDSICGTDPTCFGNISQAKLNATGQCSIPGQPNCGIDPATKQPYLLSNPSDAITTRITAFLQYLDTHGYDKNGTTWSNYLSGAAPAWNSLILEGHSQGADIATYAAYQTPVARVINLSGPPQGYVSNKRTFAATYFSNSDATGVRNLYGFVSVNDLLYVQGIYFAVWQAMGFTSANNDAEEKLYLPGASTGLVCNTGIPSHNFSTSAPVSPGGYHNDTLYPWDEDVYKFMLID